jgi:hypothetical protein
MFTRGTCPFGSVNGVTGRGFHIGNAAEFCGGKNWP